MELLKMLATGKAWEIVVALAGGYLAAKNLDKLSRPQFIGYMTLAMIIGIASTNFAIPYLLEAKYISELSAENLRPLAIIILSAASLKLMDIMHGLLAQLKEIKLKDIKISWKDLKK